MLSKVLIYCVADHPGCNAAEQYLRKKGAVDIEMAYIDYDRALRNEMWARTERQTLPQIFIGDTYVGSFSDLVALDREGELCQLLKRGKVTLTLLK
jgi:glutaredoxin 3